YLLDTNACITHLRSRGTASLSSKLRAAVPGSVWLCSVVNAELLFGAMKSKQSTSNLNEVRNFLSGFPSAPFDDVAAETCAQIRSVLGGGGKNIGPNDFM